MKIGVIWLTLFCFTFTGYGRACGKHLHLFQSGQEGYSRHRIPFLVVTQSGLLLVVCEGRVDGGGLTGDVDLVCKRSVMTGLADRDCP